MTKINVQRAKKVRGQKGFLFGICLLLFGMCSGASAKEQLAHDNRTPVEVTSDKLEVLQAQNKAIFKGNVVAVQGEVKLKADSMTVYYSKKSDGTKKPGEEGAIQKIDAAGNVFLTTQEETASGASGTYDVEHHEIRLNGEVVLTRGKNVLKGNTLVYNFDSGKSVLTGGGNAGGKGKQRVRALFVPEKNDKVKP